MLMKSEKIGMPEDLVELKKVFESRLNNKVAMLEEEKERGVEDVIQENRELGVRLLGLSKIDSQLKFRVLNALNSKNMQPFWRRLEKNKHKFRIKSNGISLIFARNVYFETSGKFNGFTYSCDLFCVCLSIINEYGNSSIKTRSQHKKFYGEISRDAVGLAKKLKAIKDKNKYDFMDMRTFIGSKGLRQLSNSYAVGDEKVDVDAIEYVESVLFGVIPSIDKILIEISRRADKFSNEYSGPAKPNKKSAKALFFASRISDYFMNSYGSRMHENVAEITNAIFKESMDADRVKKLVKSRRK